MVGARWWRADEEKNGGDKRRGKKRLREPAFPPTTRSFSPRMLAQQFFGRKLPRMPPCGATQLGFPIQSEFMQHKGGLAQCQFKSDTAMVQRPRSMTSRPVQGPAVAANEIDGNRNLHSSII